MSWSTRRTERGSSRTPLSRRVLKGHRPAGDVSSAYNAEVRPVPGEPWAHPAPPHALAPGGAGPRPRVRDPHTRDRHAPVGTGAFSSDQLTSSAGNAYGVSIAPHGSPSRAGS